ncbi:MAG: cyclic nucleotide-binding domain-containing protein, partial [Planctomycetes bacterium]|nr:cyclic nucleotide-binding domain-containing protein [Planctomycetota bacterium]
MSKQFLSIDDHYIPRVREGVSVEEVVSRAAPRNYVLIHPETHLLRSMAFKDYFLWQSIDGSKSLGQLKQEYYQKFKVLPTQHISDLVRHWLEKDFLAGGEEYQSLPVKESRVLGLISNSLSSLFLRNSLGPVAMLFSSRWASYLFVILSFALMAGVVYEGGLAVFTQVFSMGIPMSRILIYGTVAIYLIIALKSFFRLGCLFRGPRYRGDRMSMGFFFLFPFFRIATVGFLLKPQEQRVYTHLNGWVISLFLSGLCFSVFLFVPADLMGGMSATLASVGLENVKVELIFLCMGFASLVEFVVNSCPFFRSNMIYLIDEFTSGIPVRILSKLYLKDAAFFKDEKSPGDVKMVKVYLTLSFIWVIFGSSFLLTGMSRLSEGLADELQEHVNLGADAQGILQLLLYSPVIMGFLYLFWRLVQPFVERQRQNPIWKNPMVLNMAFLAIALVVSVAYYFLPQLLMRTCVSVFVGFSLMKLYRSSGVFVLATSKAQLHLQVVTLALVILSIVLLEPLILAGLGVVWLVFSGWQFYYISPSSVTWRAKSIAVATLLAVLIFFGAYSLGLAPGLSWLWLFSAGLWMSLFIWMHSGDLGASFCQATLASLAFFAACLFFEADAKLGESFICLGVICSLMWGLSMYAGGLNILKKAPSCIQSFPGENKQSLEETLSIIAASLLGHSIVKAQQEVQSGAGGAMRAYEKWFSRLLSPEYLRIFLKISLSAVSWEERGQWSEKVANYKLTELEDKVSLTLEKRIHLLRSQLLFKGFKSSELVDLAQYFEIISYQEGDLIVKQEDEGHPYLEIMVSGQALMEKDTSDKIRSVLAELKSRDAIRSEDLVRDNRYDFSVRCLSDVVTLRLHRNHFMSWGQKSPELLYKVVDSMQLADMIMNLSLFRDFSASQVRLVMEQLKKKSLMEGKVIIEQGEEGDEFYLLDEGKVEIIIN